jgi:hypothetical protein
MTFLSNATFDEKAEFLFGLYDFDKSRAISVDELAMLMRTCLGALRGMARGNLRSNRFTLD